MGLTVISSLVIGGDIMAILAQQTIRQALLFGAVSAAQVYQPTPIFIAGVPVSARKQEVYQYRAEVTRYALESAEMASDHVILYPIEIELQFELGNWYPGFPKYSLNLLETMWKSRNLLTLVTQHKQLKNMVLREFRAENEAPVWGKLDCHAVFQQIPIVNVQSSAYSKQNTTPAPNTGGPSAQQTVPPEADYGVQTPSAPSDQMIGDFNLNPTPVG